MAISAPDEGPAKLPSILDHAARLRFLERLVSGGSGLPEDFLVRSYFHPLSTSAADYLSASFDRAYLDFNRTLHGMRNMANAAVLRGRAKKQLECAFAQVSATFQNGPAGQNTFDDWHNQSCEYLCRLYRDHGFPAFAIGQAQKWINMGFKYIFALGPERIPGFEKVYAYCHVPLDKITGQALRFFGFPYPADGWSRIDSYSSYRERQQWVREHFDIASLDVEFFLWEGNDGPVRKYFRN